MADWSEETTRTPSAIGTIRLTLTDNDGMAENHIVSYILQVLDQNNGQICLASGDLLPYLAGAQVQAIENLLAEVRLKAQNELLPA